MHIDLVRVATLFAAWWRVQGRTLEDRKATVGVVVEPGVKGQQVRVPCDGGQELPCLLFTLLVETQTPNLLANLCLLN